MHVGVRLEVTEAIGVIMTVVNGVRFAVLLVDLLTVGKAEVETRETGKSLETLCQIVSEFQQFCGSFP